MMAQLLREASAHVSTERGGAVFVNREILPEPYEEHLRQWLVDPGAYLAIGTVEEVTLGMALARLEILRDGVCLGRLEWLWVESGAREIGLGAELMDLVVAWARGRGATRLDAYALPGNRGAKNFLETAGFSARLIVMHRSLGESGTRGVTP
jgi:GNAT superfamily N-acetyltransferase